MQAADSDVAILQPQLPSNRDIVHLSIPLPSAGNSLGRRLLGASGEVSMLCHLYAVAAQATCQPPEQPLSLRKQPCRACVWKLTGAAGFCGVYLSRTDRCWLGIIT